MMINNSKWIGAPRKYDKTVNVRKIFGADKKVKKAVLYSTARGFYEVYINGEKNEIEPMTINAYAGKAAYHSFVFPLPEKFDEEKGILMAYARKYMGKNYMKDLEKLVRDADVEKKAATKNKTVKKTRKDD